MKSVAATSTSSLWSSAMHEKVGVTEIILGTSLGRCGSAASSPIGLPSSGSATRTSSRTWKIRKHRALAISYPRMTPSDVSEKNAFEFDPPMIETTRAAMYGVNSRSVFSESLSLGVFRADPRKVCMHLPLSASHTLIRPSFPPVKRNFPSLV
ncbi:hypothetical protein XU18_4408 [Perkinsela sp. CCAP 1560/4]|nr:hypothetical protein XU18_4408 [Perkinsela sp. CCAP 1560/4]|eukprot:KNH04198.1 hypothetical protein XU18_4408 [Perkinsela sp. CCAP 1560/4]